MNSSSYHCNHQCQVFNKCLLLTQYLSLNLNVVAHTKVFSHCLQIHSSHLAAEY